MGRIIISGANKITTPQTLPPIGTALNNMTWEQVRAISDAGLSADYFSVGDMKAVTIQGTFGAITVDNTYYVFIIGIDHNDSIEGSNRIHFQFGSTSLTDGINIAFVDANGIYDGSFTSGSYFNMYNSSKNSGGWANSSMRNTIIPTFKKCLSTELQNVLKTVTKYTDNTGGGSNTASYVTSTIEDIFLLADWEVFGTRKYSNSAEKNYQQQYEYYASGNSKIRYMHRSTNTAAAWWLRSVDATSTYGFMVVGSSGGSTSAYSYISSGFAPAFCV